MSNGVPGSLQSPEETFPWEGRRRDLIPSELWWRDHQSFLQSRGYMLRPRYRPGWVPSWLGKDVKARHCEDAILSQDRTIIDAVRISDGKVVVLKKLPPGTTEASVGVFLSRQELQRDARNHCVPILDKFLDTDSDTSFIVMPLLRGFDNPPFAFVSEATDFVQQTLEGLVFMHEHGVAHRDLSDLNIMMDGTPLFPDGFHPVKQMTLPSGQGAATCLRRSDVPSVKYYFTDFGLSTRFEDVNTRRFVTGIDGQDRDVPELSYAVPYDPYPVDVFTLGSVYKRHLIQKYSNLAFLNPLVICMTKQDPRARPSAAEALMQFQAILARQSGTTLRWHLKAVGEPATRRLSQDIRSTVREVVVLVRKVAGSPFVLFAAMLAMPGSILFGRQSILARIRTIFGRTPSTSTPSP